MIDPAVAIHRLDGSGYELISRLFADRDRAVEAELHVLIEGAEVVSVVHTLDGPVPGPHPEVPEGLGLEAFASKLRQAHQVNRVVVVDADLIVDETAEAERRGAGDLSQPDLLLRMQAAFWSSPAVVTDPPRAASRPAWRQLEERLASLGRKSEEVTLVVAARGAGDADVVKLLARFRSGFLIELARCPDAVLESARAGGGNRDRPLLVDVAWDDLARGLVSDPAAILVAVLSAVEG